MSKRILDYDPISGITRYFDYHAPDDTAIVYSEQDVSSILDTNKAMQNEPETWKQGVKNGFAHYAQIPNIVIEKWLNEHGVNVYKKEHRAKVFQLLNQPEYRYLKTTTKMHRAKG